MPSWTASVLPVLLEDRQLTAMREFGVEDSRIILDKQSGKNFARPGCRRLLNSFSVIPNLASCSWIFCRGRILSQRVVPQGFAERADT